jgi:TRAP transporter TAXI family solute receptor
MDPDQIASHARARLPRWLRVVLVACLAVFAAGAGLYAYRTVTRPTTLTVAAGSFDGEAARIMSTIAGRLVATNSDIRLKVVDTGTALEASKAFSAGKVDLAIVRADIGDLSAARTVVLLTHGVVMILVPPGSAIEDMDGLKGKTVGVIHSEVNQRLIEVLTQEYDLTRAKVRFIDLAPADVQQALQAKKVSAVLVVMPLSEKYLSMVRNFFKRDGKRHPSLIAIESAGAIANVAAAYESYDLPKGTLRGAPPIPDDDLTTLRVPFYLVANKKLDDDKITDLTKSVMDTRRELLGAFPILAQIASPGTDKDAFIPIHPGAAAYFDGEQKTFFDKYGDALFYGPMFLGALTSLLAGAWKFMGIGGHEKAASPLDPLYALAGRIRDAHSEADLVAIEDEIDNILKMELAKYAQGDLQAADAAALSLAAHRLEYLVNYRRSRLGEPAIAAS